MRRRSASRSSARGGGGVDAVALLPVPVGVLPVPGVRVVLGLELGEPAPRRARQRDAPGQGVTHRPEHREVRLRAVGGVAGALRAGLGDVAGLGAHHVGQLQIVEEDRQELVARERERERVGAVAALAGALPVAVVRRAAFGALQPVPGHELPVAGQHHVARAPGSVTPHGLGDVARGDLHLAAADDVGDRALVDHVGHRAPDVALVAAHEALAVAGALVAVVQAAIDDDGHGVGAPPRPRAAVRFSGSCARAGTTRTAAAPASRYSPCRPCARRSSRASSGRPSSSWR